MSDPVRAVLQELVDALFNRDVAGMSAGSAQEAAIDRQDAAKRVSVARQRAQEFLDAKAALAEPAWVPVAWAHEIKEPDRSTLRLLSYSPTNPWSHWLESHREKCTYTVTPLYAAAPSPPTEIP
jgi:hypothetical protein